MLGRPIQRKCKPGMKQYSVQLRGGHRHRRRFEIKHFFITFTSTGQGLLLSLRAE